VPTKGEIRPVGRRVLVAWNGSREASRAAFDCLSLLQPGAEMKVLSVDSTRGDATLAAIGGAIERHGLNPELASVSRSEGRSVPEEILKAAADFQADLLALGCYGHSRLRETVFGGATTRILRDMTLPILMAH
jgi:nucleotide-binding universal stress UspA family protein